MLAGMNTGSSDMNRKHNKTDKTRRIWLQQEEETLIAALKEVIANGWKSDNGFKAGYLLKLEEAMRKNFPHTDIRVMPHIMSKLAGWKKNYASLTSILSRSGIGWNLNGNYTINCDNDQWEQIIKLDSNTRTMRYKSWPLYDQWKEIFGKDRANGESAEDIRDAFNEMREESQPTESYGGDYHVNMDGIFENEGLEESFSHSHKAQPTPIKNPKKKRKVNMDLTAICEVLTEMGRAANERLEILVNRIGVEFDVRKAKQEAFDKQGNIVGLSMDEKFEVCVIMAGKVELLEIFIGLPEEARPHFVAFLLKSK